MGLWFCALFCLFIYLYFNQAEIQMWFVYKITDAKLFKH